eukprot:3009964-Prymnesium_polylepis.1
MLSASCGGGLSHTAVQNQLFNLVKAVQLQGAVAAACTPASLWPLLTCHETCLCDLPMCYVRL